MSGATASGRWADEGSWNHGTVRASDVALHYVTAGPVDGDLVLLLHGFPEFWYSWREQIPALAEAGYRVVAPDLRGYNRSAKPEGVSAYALDKLVADVVGLIHAFGHESARVVGHDWGGVVAWQVASDRPDVVDRLGVLNAPHPTAYERELRSSLSQIRRSSYAFFFQIPWLPEWSLRRDDFAALEDLFRKQPVRRDAFTDEDVERYKRAFARPGVLTAAINYYRALFRRNAWLTLVQGGVGDQRVAVPTLLLWGLRDQALSPSLTEGLERWVPDLRVERYPDASHWLPVDAPERVNQELVGFL
ncbi:Pimeloyl-ACP methyl ester carboxylesterase [Halomicrobium zhouii]|uniref:Pimeloyl-ACP methyl ester carboxylesterase n=1 Tax=Halomicrobium zhouii TaxID=767519 RepID=A0A1I6KLE4_9EURY|nr:alpha/beta fold hydrolase [Halomicrobium zhouii]SFR91974.1 Pimeloyl-ACP methyl ester carboxylesterase [Halomicrobium zhouii]